MLYKNEMTNPDLTVQDQIEKFGVDFLGIITIQVLNYSKKEIGLIESYFNTKIKKINSDPDIIIKFVDEIKSAYMVYLGLNYAGFDKNNFYILVDQEEKRKVIIPFDKIGDTIEIVCEKGINSVPLLNHIINFYLIKKNFVPIHSSALYYNQKGLLVMGWTKGGKTETLLSFLNHGAQYVGDEWVVLSADGSEMYGLPVPITIWKWQLTYVKKLIGKIDFKSRIIFIFVEMLELLYKISLKLKLQSVFPFQLLTRALPQFRKLLKIRKKPSSIFKNQIKNGKTKLNTIILAFSHTSNDITVEKCDSSEISDRMMHSNDYEQIPFFEYYKTFRYAFPEKTNVFLDNIKERHSSLLAKALTGKKSFKVSHPYPVSFEELFLKLNSVLDE